jgi:nucleoid DNA-binding protein
MQQELVRMVAEKTGLSEDKAQTAAETVIGYLKSKLPAGVSSQLDNIASGSSARDMASSFRGKLGAE